MVYQWQPGTQFDHGSVVEYQGHRYKIIQPHTSQGDWTPPVTPALWGRLPDAVVEGCQPGRSQQRRQRPQNGSYGGSVAGEEEPWHEKHSQKVEIHHEEQKKHWYDIDDKRKKELEIGGGLAAGLALLGAGYYAYHEHEKSDEQKKAQVWGLQSWVHEAQTRAEEYHRYGPRAPMTWILAHGRNVPQGAFQGGEENGQPLYVARAFHEGGVQIGKAGPQFQEGAVIGFKHHEIQLGTYEVLVGEASGVKWVEAYGLLKPDELGCNLVEGGHEDNGQALFIAQANHNGVLCIGKASAVLNGAYITSRGSEECKKGYRVLAYV